MKQFSLKSDRSDFRTICAMSVHFLLLCLVMTQMACLRIEDADNGSKKGEGQTPSEQSIQSAGSNRFVHLQIGEDLFEYALQMTAPESAQSFRKIRLDLASEASDLQPIPRSPWKDTNVFSGATYQFQFVDADGELVATERIEIPLDLKFEGVVSASQMRIDSRRMHGRVYFAPGSQLVTEGKDYELKARLLQSEQGVIATWPEGATAELGQDGRGGGRIILEVENAEGDLVVQMRGQQGGEGLKGPIQTQIPPQSAQYAMPNLYRREPGSRSESCVCFRISQPAGSGVIGFQGLQGMKGAAGGNAGEFLFINKGKSNLNLKVLGIPGPGGVGGQGGDGGLGGLGGAAAPLQGDSLCQINEEAREAFKYSCPGVPEGPRGEQGPRGIQGPSGEKGGSALFCENSFSPENCHVVLDQ